MRARKRMPEAREIAPMRLVIGFAVSSVFAALLGAGFWTATLVGIVGALAAFLWTVQNG